LNQIYSPDYRKIVLNMYTSGMRVEEIARQTTVSRSNIFKWIQEADLPRHRKRQSCLPDIPTDNNQETTLLTLVEKKELVDGFLASKNKSQYARDHHIPRSTLYRWSKQNDIIQAYNGKTINVKMYLEACRTIEKKQRIIDVLQHVHCTVYAPLHIRMSEMDRLIGEYGKNVLCDALRVDHGTYANHLKRNKREKSWFIIRREELKTAIEKTYHEYNQILGIRKIHAILKQQGYRVSEHMVGELMKELGLSSIRNSAKQIYLSTVKEYENEINLKNRFPCYLPNQHWRSDFTFFPVGQIKYCICIIMDACTRVIISYKIGRKATTQMLTQCFKKAIELRKPDQNLIFHSDQGAQYTSFAFKNLLREYDIRQSFSRRGTPTDNAMIESFNHSFKSEELYRHVYLSDKKFRECVASYIETYNMKRPHESLNYDTPMHYEQQLLKQDCPNTHPKV